MSKMPVKSLYMKQSKERTRMQYRGVNELRELFQAIGAKFMLSDIGIDDALAEEALDISAAIRNRLTFNRMRRLIVD